MPMKRVYVIEDQTLLRNLVCRFVEDLSFFELVGDCGDGRKAVEQCLRIQPDIVVLDLMLPSMNGLQIVNELRNSPHHFSVLVFSAYSSAERVSEAIQAGVEGIVHKNEPLEELQKAITRVADGQNYMSPMVVDIMRDLMMNPALSNPLKNLTPREREVIQLVAEGRTTKEISTELGISVKTAETHRSNIMRKLDVHDVAGLTRFAIQNGMIELEPGGYQE